MSVDVTTQLNDLFAAQEERSKRYQALLPNSDDVSLVVLKGHLVIEEMLFEIAASHCARREELSKARLSFAQLLQVTHALVKLPIGGNVWLAAQMLNGIRNALVHNLEPREMEKKLVTLSKLCEAKDVPFSPNYKPPSEPAKIASSCIGFIMGALSVIGPVATFVERNLKLPKE